MRSNNPPSGWPTHWVKVVASLFVAWHFYSIFGAVTATSTSMLHPAPLPALQIARTSYMYREALFLHNAYRFYVPDPGPVQTMWFRLEYEGPKGRSIAYWYELPRRDDFSFRMSYQRHLSVSMLLQMQGYDITTVNSGLKALDLVKDQDIDIIFHEAAFVSVPQSMANPLPCFEINQRGTEFLLESARKAGVKRVVLASSAAVYGDSEAMPLDEQTPLRPLSPYAVSKRVDELYAELYTRSFGLEVVALRYFNVYGPRQRPDSMYAAAVPIFTRRLLDGKPVTIYGDGGQTRDLVYVGDIVRANLTASEHPAAPGQVFNVCSGDEIRVIDLVETLMDLFPNAPAPQFAPPRAGDIYRSVGNPQKAADLLGFRAQTSLADGLRQVVNWMKEETR